VPLHVQLNVEMNALITHDGRRLDDQSRPELHNHDPQLGKVRTCSETKYFGLVGMGLLSGTVSISAVPLTSEQLYVGLCTADDAMHTKQLSAVHLNKLFLAVYWFTKNRCICICICICTYPGQRRRVQTDLQPYDNHLTSLQRQWSNCSTDFRCM